MPTSQSEISMRNARQGEFGRSVRYALALGLALAVGAMILTPFVAH